MTAGCASGTTTSPAATSGATTPAASANLTMTFLPKNLGNAYFDTSFKGVQTAVAAIGGTVDPGRPGQGR